MYIRALFSSSREVGDFPESPHTGELSHRCGRAQLMEVDDERPPLVVLELLECERPTRWHTDSKPAAYTDSKPPV
jgi:hypothetical protein